MTRFVKDPGDCKTKNADFQITQRNQSAGLAQLVEQRFCKLVFLAQNQRPSCKMATLVATRFQIVGRTIVKRFSSRRDAMKVPGMNPETDLLARLDSLRRYLLSERDALGVMSDPLLVRQGREIIDRHLSAVDDACEALQFDTFTPSPGETE